MDSGSTSSDSDPRATSSAFAAAPKPFRDVPQLADEVVLADPNRPEIPKAAFAGAYGIFLVTNFANHLFAV